jgi:hypothetical protein
MADAAAQGPYEVVSENDRTTVTTIRKHVLTTHPSLICLG